MFAALGSKIVTGLMSLSMFLFSSYTGNDPSFRPLSAFVNNNYMQLSTALDYGFDNDFPDVFKSGTPITMYYKVEVRNAGALVYQITHTNRVTFEPMRNSYVIRQSGSGERIETSSFEAVKDAISQISCSIPVQRDWRSVNVSVQAWLPTVEFTQIDREVDLMVLWRFRKPSVKGVFSTHQTF